MKIIPWDDLVFTNRNRSYGAYVLRKEYPTALIASFVFMLVVMSLLFATSPFVYKILKNVAAGDKVIRRIVLTIRPPADKPASEQKKPETPVTRHIRSTTSRVVDQPVANETPAIVESQNTSAETTPSQPVSVEVSTVAQSVVPETEDPNRVWTNVEQAPEFPGGMSAMMKFIGKNTRYPASARRQSIEGSVFISLL